MLRVFANGLGDPDPGRVIPKTQKMVLDSSLLNSQYYKVWIKNKWSNPGKGVALSPTPRCSSYQKGSLRVTLDYGHQLYFSIIPSLWEKEPLGHPSITVCQSQPEIEPWSLKQLMNTLTINSKTRLLCTIPEM